MVITPDLRIVKATGLKKADLFGASDPRAEVYVNDVCVYETLTIKKNLNPIWTDEV